MILALGARGHGFNSRTAPYGFFWPSFFGPISAWRRALGRNLSSLRCKRVRTDRRRAAIAGDVPPCCKVECIAWTQIPSHIPWHPFPAGQMSSQGMHAFPWFHAACALCPPLDVICSRFPILDAHQLLQNFSILRKPAATGVYECNESMFEEGRGGMLEEF